MINKQQTLRFQEMLVKNGYTITVVFEGKDKGLGVICSDTQTMFQLAYFLGKTWEFKDSLPPPMIKKEGDQTIVWWPGLYPVELHRDFAVKVGGFGEKFGCNFTHANGVFQINVPDLEALVDFGMFIRGLACPVPSYKIEKREDNKVYITFPKIMLF